MTAGLLGSVVVTVGEELLSGATLDGNAAWLGRELARIGIPVARRETVGDRDADIVEAVRTAVAHGDLVVVTGGLGPTEDDRTRNGVARALDLELVEDAALADGLRARNRARGRGEPTPELFRLASRPAGSRVLANPAGAAPGLACPPLGARRAWVILLPGVPREMRAIFPAVETLVEEAFRGRLRPALSRVLHTTGIPESELAPRIEDALGGLRNDLEVAYLPDLLGVDLRLTVRATPNARAEARARLDAAEAAVAPVIEGFRFAAASGDLVEACHAALEARGWTLSTAESCTGGWVAQRWTAHPGASRTFRGGLVAYANEVKQGWLGVSADDLRSHGAVSESVARAMATGVCDAFETECAIGVTGIAGPDGGTDEKPVGTVWIAVTVPAKGGHRTVEAFRLQLGGGREEVRIRAAQAALHRLLRLVESVQA